MRNHFHRVLETPHGNLVAGMKWFLGTYTSRFNRRHKLVGHLFSGRYKSPVIDATKDPPSPEQGSRARSTRFRCLLKTREFRPIGSAPEFQPRMDANGREWKILGAHSCSLAVACLGFMPPRSRRPPPGKRTHQGTCADIIMKHVMHNI
jgi:hypothetical protein